MSAERAGLAVREEGDGPLVVLVHGSMDRGSSFARVRRHLVSFRVVSYDRRGYAGSLDLGPATGVAQQVDDLLGVLDGRAATVVGHSLGGVIALAASVADPGIHGVVAYEAPMPWRPWWPNHTAGGVAMGADPEDAAEAFMRHIVGDAVWERLPRSTREARRAEGRTLQAELHSLRASAAPYDPATLTVPVVAAHGTEGAEHHRRAVQTLASEAPNAEVVTIVGAGHGAHLSHPAEFAALVDRVPQRS